MKLGKISYLAAIFIFVCCTFVQAAEQDKYPIKGEHKGGDVTPAQAYDMLQKDPEHTFLVDIRTRYEYQDIGHPVGAYNIPFKFYTTQAGEKGYNKVANANFCKDLMARFNPETDTLLFMCRSAHRSVGACNVAADCGFKKVYNLLSGFEGDKIKDKNSPDYGKRMLAGWRIEGLPWSYKMEQNLMYQPDISK